MAGGDDDQTKRLAYQTSRGAVCDYIQRYMTEHPNSSWEDLKSEPNIKFAEVNDSHHAFTMLHKARQTKNETVQVYVQKLYALANDAFAKVDKGVVESQLVGFFIDDLFHDYLRMKVMRENTKTFQAAVQSALAEQNVRKRIPLRTVDSQSSKSRTEEPKEVDHIRPQKKCFLCSKTGHLAKHCRSKIINAVEQVRNSNKGEVECWKCGQKEHMKRNSKRRGRYENFGNVQQDQIQGN